MAEILSFRDLDAWNVAMDLVVTTYGVVERLPVSERFALSTQMRRAVVSIPSNVAEGHSGGTDGRFLHHVRIARGSLAELETQLEAALRLHFVSAEEARDMAQQLARTGQLLNGLLRSLRGRLLKKAAGASAVILFCVGILLH